MNKGFATALCLSLVLVPGVSSAAQLNYGRYFGTLQMDGHAEVLAVSMDAFVMQVDGPATYPELEVIVRVNLGGYFSSEYVGYDFYDPTYNFENGILELNDPKDDLSATLQVTNTDSQTILEGPVTQRMSGAKGTMRLVMQLDDTHLRLALSQLQPPFLSILKGSYLGTCGTEPADLQIETGRGLEPNTAGNALQGYSITGRLGFSALPSGLEAQAPVSRYRSLYPYSTGIYSPYTNQLTLEGSRGSLTCTKSNDLLQCVSNGYDQARNCQLAKLDVTPATLPVQDPASIFLNVPEAAKQPLPAPLPPGNDDLMAALNGNFYGFLHYENRDVYQLIEMDAVATTSTENPHIQNQVMIEPTFLLRVGSSWDSAPARTLPFPQRVFYMNPGFAFQSVDEGDFAVIGNWRVGYLSGVLYSRSYGRVGTFELIKGVRPDVPSSMMTLPDPSGSYQGPNDPSSPIQNLWSFSIEFPNQSAPGEIDVHLVGQYGAVGHRALLDAASLDLNTGTLQFLLKEDLGNRIVSGQLATGTSLRLLWPAGPAFGAPMDSYSSLPFTRIPEKP